MDEFMDDLITAINNHGARAVRIFPPASHVILYFSERIANEVVCIFSCQTLFFRFMTFAPAQLSDYISTLLSHAREISITTYLKAVPASFREAWRMVGTIMEVVKQRPDSNVSKTAIEDIV
jgi:recyclin-1